MNAAFWHSKRVIVTGHTGFKGSWLSLWLHRYGAKVTGIALPPDTTPNLFDLAHVAKGIQSYICDIRDAKHVKKIIQVEQPEIVFHLAAQPLVLTSYQDPLSTFSSNVMGTAHVLDALRGLERVRVAVMITTDKVYQNQEWPYPYRENDTLGGHDPYSASKAACELVIASYRDAFFKKQDLAVASARAGNVIGGGDWSANRLIPDAVRAWTSNIQLKVRQPKAIRPWQHVLEPLSGYLVLAEKLWDHPELAEAYNFGPYSQDVATVRKVIEKARIAFGKGDVLYGNGTDGQHETAYLSLETSKSSRVLGAVPRWTLDESIFRSMTWYSKQLQGADARSLCVAEIAEYEACV